LQVRLINNKFLVFIARMLHNFMPGLTETYSTPVFYSSLVPCKPYMVPAWLFPCSANNYFAAQNIHNLLWTVLVQ